MSLTEKIYLDYNATTPTATEVVEAMLPYFTQDFGNASSDHSFGWCADDAVETARNQVAKLVSCRPTEITFTSGATEAANLTLFGFCKRNRGRGNHIITCKTEHKAVLECMEALEADRFEVTYLDVDNNGNIDLNELEDSIKSSTILVCIMLANNETGLIHPIKSIAEIAHAKQIPVLSDITQAVGKIPVNLQDLGIDLAIFSSHKLYGPKGVGALYLNKNNKISIAKHLFGGNHEKGIRPGTLNVPGIVGFGKACAFAQQSLEENHQKQLNLRNQLEQELLTIEGVTINCNVGERLPNTTNVSFSNMDGSKLLRYLNKLAVSRGSACNANLVKPSHVLKAMGYDDATALASLRISTGSNTTSEDIEKAVSEIKKAVNQLKTVTL
ncbi:cysteine desulfurase family protein [Flagellimonas halotolerans]|uniref:cysteine desulfurase n=1 Tax=Flagellimonas halotolerans TaxID=3112164 RepID=A0ABU6ITW0_9FLAO|nr:MULTISPECIES: cysteine desulfurase family protein [unclassified Allomuricauda]MEC3966588.1 cysteine desulfurase family protein [Muricauda sp. SYSU M86414]MEC4266439.1 cysteine desulfurase family protein [Muricauda sp. SYSU M84420]